MIWAPFSVQTNIGNKQLRTDMARHAWVARFMLDPEAGGCAASSSTDIEISQADKSLVSWVTEAELGGPRFLNSLKNAKLYIKDLESRPHSLSATMAQAGVLEYQLTVEMQEAINKTTNKSGVRTEVGVSASLNLQQATVAN